MARMIPATVSVDTDSQAEARVFDALRDSLDDSYGVFHSFDVVLRNLENKIVDAEIDFLILSQRLGLLALEVKGGVIRFDGESGTWLQNGVPLRESPYRQAKKNKYAVLDFLKRTLGRRPEMPIGHAVAFPDVFSPIRNLPAEADSAITITGKELPHVDRIIPAIMRNYAQASPSSTKKHDVQAVRKALMPEFEYGMSLLDIMGAAEQQIFKLTEEQCDLLDFLGTRRQVLVKGCAGTGKTILALKKARELALADKKVLLLCYNKPLGQQLEQCVRNIPGDITATTYHAFCFRTLDGAGIDLTPESEDPDFWQEKVPEAFYKVLRQRPIKYDAVIVDEGQDFLEPYWVTIEEMCAPDGHFYIFYDPDQNLYGSELQFPIDDDPFVLRVNCRNTRQICEALIRKAQHADMRLRADAPEGKPIVEVRCPSPHKRRRELSRILHTLIHEEGLPPERIVVLGGHSIKNTCLRSNCKVGNFTIEHEPESRTASIRYYTYMRFKGCESDVVILLDVDPKDSRWASQSALYTAMSRAKFLLYVLYKDE